MATVSSLLSSSQITSLIQQASAAYQLPAATVQTQETPIKAQISGLGKVQSALSGLQSALAGLANVASLGQRTVSATPNGVVEATATNAAALGNYSLSNIQLAHAETLISSGSPNSSGSLGAGSLSIKIGSGSTVTVNISSGSSSLAGIAAAIDSAGVAVNATVVFDGSSYHLVLTGDGTGSANAFTVTGSGGLAGLSYYTGVSGLSRTEKAPNAGFSLNGLTITSGSNTVSGVIPGVSLTLSASGSATVTVSQSISDLDSAAQSLAQALNSTLATINQETALSTTSSGSSGSGGPSALLGDIGVQELKQSLLDSLTANLGVGSAAGSSSYNSLSSIGFQITSGGTLAFNNSTFEAAAQTNYTAVAALLGAAGVASNPNVSVNSVASAPPGSYTVDVTSNANGTVVGAVNGLAASGTDGDLVVTSPGSLYGLALQIEPGVTGNLGTVTVSQGLYGSLSSVVNAALASGSGSVTGQIGSLNKTITGMNTQITALQKEATQETQALNAQYSAAQATLEQLTTTSSFLTSYFSGASGSGGVL
jgi:flagellar hook-associated protein 2